MLALLVSALLSALRAFNKLLTLYLIKVFFSSYFFLLFLYIFFFDDDDVDAYQRSSLDSWDSLFAAFISELSAQFDFEVWPERERENGRQAERD